MLPLLRILLQKVPRSLLTTLAHPNELNKSWNLSKPMVAQLLPLVQIWVPLSPKKLVTEAVNAFGKIDIIVNNGAVWKYEPIEEIKASTFDTFFAINVRGPLLLVQASLPYLQDNGRIINISSISARAGHPASSVYGGTKAALEAMSRAWASELGPKHNITSNCVGAGLVLTEMIEDELEAVKASVTNAPLARVADTSDITDIVGFLASEQSHWVTGDVISANGGLVFL